MADSITARVHSATTWSIVLSMLMIATGVLAVFLPQIAGVAITVVVGWLLLFSGIMHLVYAWRAGSAGAVVWEILIGLVYGAIGLYILARPDVGLASVTLALAMYLFFEAILEFALWARVRPADGSGWLLFDGILTLVLAVMVLASWPSSSAWVLGTLVGISMLFSGMSRLMLSLAVRRLVA
jgi:uncharacterized membrane protein HdeD (DUF308 family)